MKTLYVHIGSPKTASTAIQFFCVENSDVLKKKGFYYPLLPKTFPDADAMRAHFLIIKLTDKRGRRDKKWEEKVFREGMDVVNESFRHYDNVILSDERIWLKMDTSRKNLWKKLKKEAKNGGFQIRVIAYVRRQDKLLISLWNQQVKIIKMELAKVKIEDWMNQVNLSARLEYYEKLERIADVIGKENIIVRRFDDGKFEGGSIYSDFLIALGLSLTDEYDIKQEVRNIGLYGNTQEIKRVINRLPQMIKDKAVQNFIMDRLLECSEISRENYPCEMLSGEEIQTLLDIYAEGNRKIAEEYLHEPAGTELFNNTIKDLPKWQKDNPFLFDDLVRFTNVSIAWLYARKQEFEKAIEELEKEVEKLLKASAKKPLEMERKRPGDTAVSLPKWNKETPDGIDELILFVGAALIQLYQENRDLSRDVKALKTEIEKMASGGTEVQRCVEKMTIHFYRMDKDAGKSAPKWEGADNDADGFIRFVDMTAKQISRENQGWKQETAEIKAFTEAAHTQSILSKKNRLLRKFGWKKI